METPELHQLYLAIQNFREAMERDLKLNEFERLSLENYIAFLQLTYMEWKRRNPNQMTLRRAA